MTWFDNKSRISKLLDLFERKSTYSVDELSKNLEVSNRTVRKEIESLNELLKGSALVELIKGEYKLYLFDIPKFVEIKNQLHSEQTNFNSQNNRLAFIFKELSSNENLLVDDLADLMNVSRTTLNKDLRDLRKILKSYQLEIKGKTNVGISLTGSEFNIRRFILDNLFELMYSKSIIDSDIQDEYKKIVEGYNLESFAVKQLEKYLTLALDRFLNGYQIQLPNESFYKLQNQKLFGLVEKINKLFKKHYGIDFPVEEEIFLILPLIGTRTPLDLQNYENFFEIDNDILNLVNKIISEIKKQTDLTFRFDETLDEFILHILFLINRIKYQIKLENPLTKELKEKYPLAWSIAELTANVIESELHISVNEDEIGYLTAYFEILIRNQRSKTFNSFKIVIISNQGGASVRLIRNILQRVLGNNVEIEIIPKQFEYDNLSQYDLIILTEPQLIKTDTPILIIDEVYDEDVIRERINRIIRTNQTKIESRTSSNSILLSLLDDNKIFQFDESKTYLETLVTLADIAIDEGLADKNFKERLLNREKQSSMRFSEHLAFPHTYQTLTKEPFCLIALIPHGLKGADEGDLRIVILCGLPEKTSNDLTLVKLYEEILILAKNNEIIKSFSNLTSYNEILNFFIVENPIFDT